MLRISAFIPLAVSGTVYQWWKFIHLVGVFAFLMSHGTSVAMLFKIRKERDPERIRAYYELSATSSRYFYYSLGFLLAAGVVLGFLGDWWGHAWIWTALVVLIGTAIAMYFLAKPYYRRISFVARAKAGGSTAVSDEQVASILLGPRPWVIAGLGFGSLLLLLYLMMFKPSW